jgi:hypothetical protein
MKAFVCFGFGALLFGLGLLIVPEGLRDFRRFALLREANVQVPAEVLAIEHKMVPRHHDSEGPGSPTEPVEDATLRYAVDGRTYTCVARLYLPIGQTKVGDRLGVHYVATDPARCYLPNAVVGSWVMSLLAPILLMGIGAVVFYVGLVLRGQR